MAVTISQAGLELARRSGPIAVIVLCIIIILFGSTLPYPLREAVIGVAAITILFSAAVEMYVYLQTAKGRIIRRYGSSYDDQRTRELSDKLSEEMHSVRKELEEIKLWEGPQQLLSPDDKERLLAQIANSLREFGVKDIVKTELEALQTAPVADPHIASLRATAAHMLERLEDEVRDLGKRANLNLLIGITISLSGLLLLGWFVLSISREQFAAGERLDSMALYVTTRVTLVVFVEVFAYFFLRLYRYGIFEIKYFQNEVTNAEFRYMALEAALNSNDKKIIDKICLDMAKTERNFILKKGETTQALRREEIEQVHDKSLMSLLERALGLQKRSNAKNQSAGAA